MPILHACAKINLFLDVLDKRPDGYHNVSTVMQSVELADIISLSGGAGGVDVTYAGCAVCDFHDDLIVKAWKALIEATGRKISFTADVAKVIPIAAGLGGGSADAAAALIGLNILADLNLSPAELSEIGAKIGADVPFFLTGGTALAEGAGEKITPVAAMPDCHIVIAKPPVNVSTGRAYQAYDDYREETTSGRTTEVLAALKAGDYERLCGALHNSFEPVIIAAEPAVGEVKKAMLEAGANAALMSGSGSSVFALTREAPAAETVAAAANKAGAAVFITKPCQSAVVVID